jgi:hypothetical protein
MEQRPPLASPRSNSPKNPIMQSPKSSVVVGIPLKEVSTNLRTSAANEIEHSSS